MLTHVNATSIAEEKTYIQRRHVRRTPGRKGKESMKEKCNTATGTPCKHKEGVAYAHEWWWGTMDDSIAGRERTQLRRRSDDTIGERKFVSRRRVDSLSVYEKKRRQTIEINNFYLECLGLGDSKKSDRKKAESRRKKDSRLPILPIRKSNRCVARVQYWDWNDYGDEYDAPGAEDKTRDTEHDIHDLPPLRSTHYVQVS